MRDGLSFKCRNNPKTRLLDLPSVAWFAEFLKKWNRCFLLISHDREFLNEQISRVVSLELEGVRTYPGNYDRYLAQREEEETILLGRAKNLARERERLQRFVDRFRAQANKARAVQSRHAPAIAPSLRSKGTIRS